jgi:hypothetical protein
MTQREALFIPAGPAAPSSFVVRGIREIMAPRRAFIRLAFAEALVESGQPILLRGWMFCWVMC